MKQLLFIIAVFLYLFLFIAPLNFLQAQANCVLQPPVLKIDFGNDNSSEYPDISFGENYDRVYDHCPQDGHYTIVSSLGDCFNGHWVTSDQDHTPNDNHGKMVLVNSAYEPGVFFVTPLKGLSSNTIYELAVWIVNVCKPEYECTDIRPNLRFTIENADGSELARFATGAITPTGQTSWMQYSAQFKTPDKPGTLYLKIENKANGGCGNDFAMDDITVRECVVPKPVVKVEPKPVTKQSPPATKPVVKQTPPAPNPVKKIIPVITKAPVNDTPLTARPVIKERPAISLPKPLMTRANPIVKQIETATSEIVIDLYDNGEIDGDTVSIYHNNALIVSRAGLSAKPVTFHFNVNDSHPHHELVMVANNLGSIPPNTSLMIITTSDKRYEVFISSSEQKNAKVVIDLRQ